MGVFGKWLIFQIHGVRLAPGWEANRAAALQPGDADRTAGNLAGVFGRQPGVEAGDRGLCAEVDTLKNVGTLEG